jgi:hypothetical protein
MNMESFNAPQSEEEVPKTREELVEEIAATEARVAELKALSAEVGENIDVELGSEEYVDYGHMAQARELEGVLEDLKTELIALDDESALNTIADAAQRKLDI